MSHLDSDLLPWWERSFWWLIIVGNVAFIVVAIARCVD